MAEWEGAVTKTPASIARSCELLSKTIETLKERNEQYGDPTEVFGTLAGMWEAILQTPVSRQEVALCLAALKIARLVHQPGHQDSLKDLIGYAALYSEFDEYKEQVV